MKDQPNIYDYFDHRLGMPPNEESLKQLPVNSNCGLDCKLVIDKAKELMDVCDTNQALRQTIVDVANDAVEVYWLG